METSLYSPVKRFLEGLRFEVKGEVCGCDLVALDRGAAAAVVIGELKLSFTLELVLQAVDGSAACDDVWVAVRASTGVFSHFKGGVARNAIAPRFQALIAITAAVRPTSSFSEKCRRA